MKKNNLQNNSFGYLWFRFFLWLLMFYYGIKFIIDKAVRYFYFNEETYEEYWKINWLLLIHILAGLVVLLIGPLQFFPYFRAKNIKIHKWLGKIYLAGIILGSFFSLYIAIFFTAKSHWTWAAALIPLSVIWLLSALLGYRAAKNGKLQLHKEWMIRSYIITFTFVTFRWLMKFSFFAITADGRDRTALAIWLGWTVPLFINEAMLNWIKRRTN